jgi:hypothetical protein
MASDQDELVRPFHDDRDTHIDAYMPSAWEIGENSSVRDLQALISSS